MIEKKKRNIPQAIAHFEHALSLNRFQWGGIISFSNQAGIINSLASAYYESGDIKRAEQEYQKISALTIGRLADGYDYSKSFYMLGKIYEQQNNTVNAIEQYGKFLDLWKNADPGLPEVEDAQKRLARLKGEI